MSRDGSTTLTWADSEYHFRLGWHELELLQEATDMGPWHLQSRLEHRICKIGEIAEVMRCGLIGGGIEPVKAKSLVDLYVKQRPPTESILHAYAILTIALQGAPEEKVGEDEAADQKAETA